MKRTLFLLTALALTLSACGTSATPSVPSGAATIIPSPISQADLESTAAVMAQQTLDAMPSATPLPTNTPVVVTETATLEPSPTVEIATATETANPVILTLTATLMVTSEATLSANAATSTPTLAVTSAASTADSEYPQTYGTMPPSLPAGKVVAVNQAKTQAYVSIHSTSKDGYVSFVEFPLAGKSNGSSKVPAGNCSAVVWVDGKKFSASFKLLAGGTATITITNKGISVK